MSERKERKQHAWNHLCYAKMQSTVTIDEILTSKNFFTYCCQAENNPFILSCKVQIF